MSVCVSGKHTAVNLPKSEKDQSIEKFRGKRVLGLTEDGKIGVIARWFCGCFLESSVFWLSQEYAVIGVRARSGGAR